MKKTTIFMGCMLVCLAILFTTGCGKETNLTGAKWDCIYYFDGTDALSGTFEFKDNNRGIWTNGKIFQYDKNEYEFSYTETEEKITIDYDDKENIPMVAHSTLYKNKNTLSDKESNNKNEAYTECIKK